jgi:hypothetical protein
MALSLPVPGASGPPGPDSRHSNTGGEPARGGAGIEGWRRRGLAEDRRRAFGQRTILFVDEVHHFNKAQQDALLPWVENGTVILVGATTENPYFEVNKALVSRSRVFQLRPLTAGNS